MSRAVSTLLERRLASLAGEDRRSGITVSLVMHLALILTIWLVSTADPKAPAFDEFSRVRLVPVAALGSRTAPREQVRQEPPQREPEPTPEPEPEQAPPRSTTPQPAATPSSTRRSDEPAPTREVRRAAPRPAPTQRAGTPGGSRLGTSLAGSAVASLDSPDFTYSYYTDQLLAQIDEVWNRPVIGGSVEAVVRFVIRRDGSLVDVQLARSSGYNSFDLAAMRAIRAAAPFPPLPAAFKSSTLGVNLTVR